MRRDDRPHGVAWWLWATGLATAALRTSNPLLLVALAAVVILVAAARHADAPWGRSLGTFVRLGLIVIALRVVLQLIFGERLPGHVLFTIPSVPLPGWAEGVSIGGPVTVESILTAVVGGLRLAVVLICFGAANSLASPREVLRSLPGILHEVAVAITVALCFAPEVLASVIRVRAARRLRGRPTTGVAGIRGIAVPVLEDALERSIQLAASMGARGFGRRPPVHSVARSRVALVGVGVGSLLVLAGAYGLLSPGSGVPASGPLAIVGVVIVAAGVSGSGRRAARTRYRPAPFGARSIACVLAGWTPLVAFVIIGMNQPGAITWSAYPLAWPEVPLAAIGAVAVALVALVVSPARASVTQEHRPVVEVVSS